jgi:hypothetical protein
VCEDILGKNMMQSMPYKKWINEYYAGMKKDTKTFSSTTALLQEISY